MFNQDILSAGSLTIKQKSQREQENPCFSTLQLLTNLGFPLLTDTCIDMEWNMLSYYYQASDQTASDQMGIMKSFKPNTIVVSPPFLLHLYFA